MFEVVSERDIAEFGDLWGLMYLVFAREMVESFGEEGEEALRRAIRNYGMARGRSSGRGMRMRGSPSTSSPSSRNKTPRPPRQQGKRELLREDERLSYVYVCPYERLWRSRGGSGLGMIYCQVARALCSYRALKVPDRRQ